MLKAIGMRLGQALLVLLGVVTLVFFALRLVPGDPTQVIAPTASPEARAQLRSDLGLDLPLLQQYFVYLKDMATGDFGTSYFFDGGTMPLVMAAFPYTANLLVVALLIGLVIALPLGALAARYRRKPVDRAILGVSIVAQSTPSFLIAIVSITTVATVFSLPVVGYTGLKSLILPGIALGMSLIGVLTQSVRNNLASTLDGSLAEALRSRGASIWHIILRHGSRLSAVAVSTLVGIQLGFLLGGAVIVEFIFNYPGLGLLTLNAVLRRDYPLIQAISIMTALIFVVLNLLIDLSHGVIDPRVARTKRVKPKNSQKEMALMVQNGASS